MTADRSDSSSESRHDSTVVETLQSLIVAFVLAMTFRGFVVEGFVIPTGSMAPTLMGLHARQHSGETGYEFPTGVSDLASRGAREVYEISDPMLGEPGMLGEVTARSLAERARAGDRILVLKALYPFFRPDRFDVVVFKNPAKPGGPNGETGNYIKRLIGLPNERIWITDGDVFVAPADDPERRDDFTIARKPLHVQRTVWQPVHDADYVPTSERFGAQPPAWYGEGWETAGVRAYRCDTAEPTTLNWNARRYPLDDDQTYNMIFFQNRRRPQPPRFYVADLRVAATVVPDAPGFATTLRLEARQHVHEFVIDGSTATVRMRDVLAGEDDWWATRQAAIDPLVPGRPTRIEFWHVDQAMWVFIGDEPVLDAPLAYDWTPEQRQEFSSNRPYGAMDDERRRELARDATEFMSTPRLTWSFAGSPVTLHRVSLDRDIHYHPGQGTGLRLSQTMGTHPDRIAELNGDQFFMCGDNSAASKDSRLWGEPHAIVAEQLDPAPFVVHRTLLIGKAWVVYFPAMHPLWGDGPAIVPDFGRLRFIR